MPEAPPHIPYFKSMLERNYAFKHEVTEHVQQGNISVFIFKRNYFSSCELDTMCKYCKIDPDYIIEWQVEPLSIRNVRIKIFVKWAKDVKFEGYS